MSTDQKPPAPSPIEIFNHAWNALEAEQGKGKVLFPKEILWLNGAPGAGKGTHTKTIIQIKGFKTPSIEMSSLFKTPEAKKLIDAGILIDDKTATTLLFRALTQPQYREGVVMDGYPRTAPQGEILKLLFKKLQDQKTPSKFQIIALFVDEAESVRRQVQRAGEDQAAGKPVRATDLDPEKARKRHQIFMAETYLPLKALANVFPFHSLETVGTIEEMGRKITKTIG
jgi:adenylate kinase